MAFNRVIIRRVGPLFWLLGAMNYFSTALLSLGLCVAAFPNQASACMCPAPASIGAEFERASVVVAAEAINITTGQMTLPLPDRPDYSMSTQIVEWRVSESWKGIYATKTKIITEVVEGSSHCLITVRKGDLYVLYLSGKKPYAIGSCGRSRLLKDALKDVPTLYKLSDKIQRRT